MRCLTVIRRFSKYLFIVKIGCFFVKLGKCDKIGSLITTQYNVYPNLPNQPLTTQMYANEYNRLTKHPHPNQKKQIRHINQKNQEISSQTKHSKG